MTYLVLIDRGEGHKKRTNRLTDLSLLVGLLGFEPRQTESKSVVLPLHHNPERKTCFGSAKIRVVKKCSKSILCHVSALIPIGQTI